MKFVAYWLFAGPCAVAINVWLMPPWWAGIALAAVVSMVVDTWLRSFDRP